MIGPIDHAKSMHFQYDLASLVQSRGLQVPLLTLPKGHHVCSFSHSSTLHALKSLGLAVPREESCNHGTKPHNPVIQGNIWWTLVDSLGDVSDVHTYGKFDPCTSSEIQTPGDSWGTWRSPRYKLRRQLEGNWINWFRLWIFTLGHAGRKVLDHPVSLILVSRRVARTTCTFERFSGLLQRSIDEHKTMPRFCSVCFLQSVYQAGFSRWGVDCLSFKLYLNSPNAMSLAIEIPNLASPTSRPFSLSSSPCDSFILKPDPFL